MLQRDAVVRAVVWIADNDCRLRLSAHLRHVEVRWCENPFECAAAVRQGGFRLAVLGYLGAQRNAVLALAPQLRRLQPLLYVALYVDVRALTATDLLVLGRQRVDRLIVHGQNDDRDGWSETIQQVSDKTTVRRVLHVLEGRVPSPIATLVRQCLTAERRNLAVGEVAARLHVSRRTLVRHCQAARCPGPAALISWCRLLYAAHLLDDGMLVEQSADAAGFSSGVALRNMLRRYTGLRPAQLRERGGFEWLLESFAHRLSTGELSQSPSSTDSFIGFQPAQDMEPLVANLP